MAVLQIMEKEGVTRYNPLGEPFDPNLHNALFEVPDATKEPGTVAVVIKVRPSRIPHPLSPAGFPPPGQLQGLTS